MPSLLMGCQMEGEDNAI